MSNHPPAVDRLVSVVESFHGIKNVQVALQAIDHVEVDHLSLPMMYADLPHLAIRRSNGGKKNEALVSLDFELTKDGHGWIALEYLAWWVRDMCRSEHEIQLRPQALPPSNGTQSQLGTTLSFTLEIFVVEPDDDAMKIAEYVGECGDSLQSTVDLYSKELKSASPRKGLFG